MFVRMRQQREATKRIKTPGCHLNALALGEIENPLEVHVLLGRRFQFMLWWVR